MNRPTAFDTRTVQSLADCARAHGVVGAGGGGYSLADKLLARPYQTLIINAAQSEPLICKDWAALAQYGQCVLDGASGALVRDTRRGQSLVVWAIREGRQCAREVDLFLMGSTSLPR